MTLGILLGNCADMVSRYLTGLENYFPDIVFLAVTRAEIDAIVDASGHVYLILPVNSTATDQKCTRLRGLATFLPSGSRHLRPFL